MASYTTNLNLREIDLADAPPDITVLNQNWEILDQAVEDKTVKQLLTYDGADILKDGTRLEFDTLYDMLMNKNDFVVCLYDDVAYHPMEVTNEKITFIAVSPNGDTIDMPQISIANDDLSTVTFNDTGARSKTWTPTATDVGAVSTSVTTYTTVQDFNDFKSTGFYYFNYLSHLNAPVTTCNGLLFVISASNVEKQQMFFQFGGNNLKQNVYFRKYHSGIWDEWDTVFLPLSGGTLSGLAIDMSNGRSRFQGNGATTAMIGRNVANDDSNRRLISISCPSYQADVSKSFYIRETINGTNKDYTIFGEHNKPSGTFTGNGSATQRKIQTNAIGGYACLIMGANGSMALVTSSAGAIAKTGYTNAPISISQTEVYISEQTKEIIISSTSDALNRNGTTYRYYVL